ncbi:transposase [Arthrobacter pigmenti]
MTTMTRKRRSFTPEYKKEAAMLVIETDRTVAAVAAEIGVGEQTLGRWVRAEREKLNPEKKLSVAELEAENARLRMELYEARKDKEFLGKAASFFAQRRHEQNGSN